MRGRPHSEECGKEVVEALEDTEDVCALFGIQFRADDGTREIGKNHRRHEALHKTATAHHFPSGTGLRRALPANAEICSVFLTTA